ncbi:hypothetical protein J8273_2677 [Carpediemonas membranifera]|uniref:WD40 repeat protein n=1 Tax=Carpediemonas membranifera TaxID=201153 RepID=A0A8J6AYX2_9EUKA|nr:hypothetical protein J8273_2677 [Carpediemonas membranifera]|eukprot:KAG9395765.1 hypothetical protein J8273_2677 [Carpediemonas membranifera]
MVVSDAFHRIGGAIKQPVFTNDGKAVLFSIANMVYTVNARSGACTQKFEAPMNVAHIAMLYESSQQILMASSDSVFVLQGISPPVTVATHTLSGYKLLELIPGSSRDTFYAILSDVKGKARAKTCLARLVVDSSALTLDIIRRTERSHRPQHTNLVLGPDGMLVATIDHTAWVLDPAELEYGPECVHVISHTRPFTAVACSDATIALGDDLGVIRVLRDPLDVPSPSKLKDLTVQLLPWHTGPISSLLFGPSPSEVYSGGHEGVLVSWNLVASSSDFLPRLGGSIIAMVPGPEGETVQVAVLCSDNAVRLLDLTHRSVVFTYRGLAQPTTGHPAFQVYPIQNPGLYPPKGPHRRVLTAGTAGSLSLFDATEHVNPAPSRLAVVTRNYATDVGDSKAPPAHAHWACFSADGAVMASADGAGRPGVPETTRVWFRESQHAMHDTSSTSLPRFCLVASLSGLTTDVPVAMDMSADGAWLVVADRSGAVKILSIGDTVELAASFMFEDYSAITARVNPDCSKVHVLFDHQLVTIDLKTRDVCAHFLLANRQKAGSIDYLSDGRLVLATNKMLAVATEDAVVDAIQGIFTHVCVLDDTIHVIVRTGTFFYASLTSALVPLARHSLGKFGTFVEALLPSPANPAGLLILAIDDGERVLFSMDPASLSSNDEDDDEDMDADTATRRAMFGAEFDDTVPTAALESVTTASGVLAVFDGPTHALLPTTLLASRFVGLLADGIAL